jgi:hypothetical protein
LVPRAASCRTVCTQALCSPPWRSGALHAGAPNACGAYSCGLGAGVSGPDAPDLDPLFMTAAWPCWSWPAKLYLLRVVPCARCSCAARSSALDSDLELSTLAFSLLAALSAVVLQPASQARARMLQTLHICSLARLVKASQALSPPRRAMGTRSLCCQQQRPGALHAGALHAGGALSCGLGASVSGPDAPDPDPAALHVGSQARLVTAHLALSPPHRAVCMQSLCCQPQRPGL